MQDVCKKYYIYGFTPYPKSIWSVVHSKDRELLNKKTLISSGILSFQNQFYDKMYCRLKFMITCIVD
jgi:hypothetical protein